ncbi:MAG: hypothetical protein AAFY26_06240 [Cyanobacteria bacterium J06638_22]
MQVENVYQDPEGKWHVDYSVSHLMGLAIRVYFGQFLISLILVIPIMIISVIAGIALGQSLAEETETSGTADVQHETVCAESQ